MIEMTHVAKSFAGHPVLRDVSLTVAEGESVVLIGRSGSGKSVMLRHILGLIQPDSGRVVVDGVPVSERDEREIYGVRRKIGMLFQNAALWDSMSVYDNIALALRHHKMLDEEEISERVESCLSSVGLGGIGDKMPSELSGGMRKRVGLARAIATRPTYMLYDEPTTGLDPIMSAIINELIIRLNEELKVTSLTITHDMRSAMEIADRILMLHRGTIIFDGTPEQLAASDDPVVRQFYTGSSEGPIHPIHTDHYTRTLRHH
ncbi:MAG TPA: ABC transporter ATP-binding protein [Bacteroidetes bacterium]|nr:ABC transporter ATP-binding protein [Bacteroidota bacterium]